MLFKMYLPFTAESQCTWISWLLKMENLRGQKERFRHLRIFFSQKELFLLVFLPIIEHGVRTAIQDKKGLDCYKRLGDKHGVSEQDFSGDGQDFLH